ncbi:ribosomal protein S18-alanine N-acetyltransferase [Pseudoalteromonas sp. MMG024]|uniref:ribosomal protein S18-alanine N-acetyltransferase n=1 Tax=Pseudoalteromonas sp. MMG024 TaxID=2909980 RepID=UPI001F02E743|nr:ribosomal protein S18-alanine N-acetyltransferase [Pseudoalteromonas sp. MMG024]MCF6456929.1 ribosomal protein S18-alanine N-acetyltransferase [Pseudoalteromonas sp. MMG024]
MATDLIVKLDQTYLHNLMAIEQQCHAFPMSEKLMASCLSGRYSAYGCLQSNALQGFYILEQVGPDYTLMDICVNPENQGKGLAKAMLTHLLGVVKAANGENVFLEVRQSNQAAIHLYTTFDFVETGVRKNYYPSESGREDAILMALSF